MSTMIDFSDLLGLTIKDSLICYNYALLKLSDGSIVVMGHEQDCCESVTIDEISGDIRDLYNHPILVADETESHSEDESGTETWSFYKLATVNGWVDIRWYGLSNGCYSEKAYTYLIQNNYTKEVSELLQYMDVSNEDMDMVCKWINLP